MEMNNKKEHIAMDIDIVYLWVDGSDTIWQTKRNSFIGKTNEKSQINCKGRYANNDELKYSLRSIEKYAPWIRNIYIVTDDQKPEWLNLSNFQIRIVDHKEIMPAESLPCFNSSLIEHFLYKIPGLAEHFLFANDDMFINKQVTPNDFFTTSGFPIIRLVKKPFRKLLWFWREKICNKPLKNYTKILIRSTNLVENKYGICYTGKPHHNIDAYLRSDYQRIVENTFYKEFSANNKNHMRSDDDVHRSIISYTALAEKRGQLRYVTEKESVHLKIHRKQHYKKLEDSCPLFFCMNDSEYADDNDRIRAKKYLEKRFPKKSKFEK